MPYKINSDKPEYTRAFFDYVLTPLQNATVDIEKVLDGLSFYFGINPSKNNGINTNGDYYDPNKRNIVKPIIQIIEGLDLKRQLRAIFKLIVHEIGHDIHFTYLKDDIEKWKEWSEFTNNKLDLEWRKLGNTGYEYAPSYETFANDFMNCIYEFDLPKSEINKKRKYYFGLWGQEYIPQKKIELWIDKKNYLVDGETKIFDVAPIIKDGRTMLELRNLLIQIMEVKVEDIQWDETEQKVTFIINNLQK